MYRVYWQQDIPALRILIVCYNRLRASTMNSCQHRTSLLIHQPKRTCAESGSCNPFLTAFCKYNPKKVLGQTGTMSWIHIHTFLHVLLDWARGTENSFKLKQSMVQLAWWPQDNSDMRSFFSKKRILNFLDSLLYWCPPFKHMCASGGSKATSEKSSSQVYSLLGQG